MLLKSKLALLTPSPLTISPLRMRPDVHQYTILVDIMDMTSANFSLSQCKFWTTTFQSCFCDRSYRTIIMNMGWIARKVFGIIKKILRKRSAEKFRTVGVDKA